MNTENTTLSVGGYRFFTEKDARLAQAEQQKIEYLEARIDYSAPESIRYIYEQTIQERLFKTPVGLRYLEKLRSYLLEQPGMEPGSVMDIPLYMTFDGELRDHGNPARERDPCHGHQKTYHANFLLSCIQCRQSIVIHTMPAKQGIHALPAKIHITVYWIPFAFI